MKVSGLIFSVLTVALALSAFADEETPYNVPIQWQKVQLQKQIEEAISRSVQTVVDRSKFNVSVDIKLTGARTFETGGGAKAQGGKDFPLAKLGLNQNSAAYKKAISEASDNVFTRIGAVIVNLTIDNSVAGTAERQAREFVPEVVRSFVEANPELKVKRLVFYTPPPEAKETEVAKSNLAAAKALADAIQQSNGKIAEAINLVQNREPAADKKGDTEVKAEGTKPVEKLFPTNWKQALMEFQIPLAILIATILFMLTIGGFKKIENQKVAVMAAANAAKAGGGEAGAEEMIAEAKADAAEGATVVGAVSGAAAGGESAFDQFRKMAENNAEQASFLVKSWVNMDTDASREAIAVLTKAVPFESLVPVVQTMSEDLKSRFKRASQTPVDAAAMARAEGFIVEQMVENFLVNTVELPPEVKKVMSSMSIKEAVECVKKDKRLGGIFVNVLQTAQVVRLLKLLPEGDVATVLQEGVKYSADGIEYLNSTLGNLLTQIRGTTQTVTSPLVQRGIELIATVGAEREGQVLQMLLSSGAKDQVVEATARYYPAELLLTFPPDKLRVLLGTLSTKQRGALIYSRNEKDRKLLMAAVGETGRVREMIDEEIREIDKSEPMKAQIKKNQAKIWQDFVAAARQAIRTETRLKDTADEILKKWLVSKGVDASKLATAEAA